MSVFTTRNSRSSRKGYIKRLSDRTYLAMEYDYKHNIRYRAKFDTYMRARSWMFARGMWVEL